MNSSSQVHQEPKHYRREPQKKYLRAQGQYFTGLDFCTTFCRELWDRETTEDKQKSGMIVICISLLNVYKMGLQNKDSSISSCLSSPVTCRGREKTNWYRWNRQFSLDYHPSTYFKLLTNNYLIAMPQLLIQAALSYNGDLRGCVCCFKFSHQIKKPFLGLSW